MDIELRSKLVQILRQIDRGEVLHARESISDLIAQMPHDTWLESLVDAEISNTVDLLEFTRSPFDEISSTLATGVIRGLASSSRRNVPFLLRTMDAVFPPRIYRFLETNFPARIFFKPRKDAAFLDEFSFTRYELKLDDRSLVGAGHTVRKLWLGVSRCFHRGDVQAAVFQALKIPLPAILNCDIRLMNDRAGFSMAPHTDGGNGALLTFQVYFPMGTALEDHGTEFFARDGTNFRLTHRQKNTPNGGHLFAVSEQSWHGVARPIPKHAENRRSLVVRYMS